MDFKWGFVIILSFLTLACAQEKTPSTGATSPSVPSKPLPTECTQDLLARLKWQPDLMAFGYTVQLGTEKNVFTTTLTVAKEEKHFLLLLARGATYFIRVNKYQENGGAPLHEDLQLFVPTCAQRSSWQQSNPTYTEPFDYLVTFVKKY